MRAESDYDFVMYILDERYLYETRVFTWAGCVAIHKSILVLLILLLLAVYMPGHSSCRRDSSVRPKICTCQ